MTKYPNIRKYSKFLKLINTKISDEFIENIDIIKNNLSCFCILEKCLNIVEYDISLFSNIIKLSDFLLLPLKFHHKLINFKYNYRKKLEIDLKNRTIEVKNPLLFRIYDMYNKATLDNFNEEYLETIILKTEETKDKIPYRTVVKDNFYMYKKEYKSGQNEYLYSHNMSHDDGDIVYDIKVILETDIKYPIEYLNDYKIVYNMSSTKFYDKTNINYIGYIDNKYVYELYTHKMFYPICMLGICFTSFRIRVYCKNKLGNISIVYKNAYLGTIDRRKCASSSIYYSGISSFNQYGYLNSYYVHLYNMTNIYNNKIIENGKLVKLENTMQIERNRIRIFICLYFYRLNGKLIDRDGVIKRMITDFTEELDSIIFPGIEIL